MTFGSTWMPWAGDDFWESERVAQMDDSAVALYQWLLWRQFKHGPLPPPDVLRRLPHRWQANWDEVWPQVALCFERNEDGRLENPRCREERAAALERSERAHRNGAKGGRPPNQNGTHGKATANLEVSGNGTNGKAAANPRQSSDRTVPDQTEHTACAQRARAREASPSEPEQAPDALAGGYLALHQALDVPAVREAVARWEAHLREHGKPWGSSTWSLNVAKWAGWGPERTVRAIDTAIGAGKFTPFEPAHGERKAEPKPAGQPPPREPADARAVEREWCAMHAITAQVKGPDGTTITVPATDQKYPGYELAKRELMERRGRVAS